MNKLLSSNKPIITHLNLIEFIFYLSMLTSSFDVFLTFSICGFTFRAAQIILLFLLFFGILASCLRKKLKPVLGFSYLLFWTLIIVLFTPHTHFLIRNIGYSFWLIFNVMMIFATVQLFTSYQTTLRIIRFYIITFFVIAIFGLLQFILPILHLGAPFVMQWWFPGLLPRINGFSYEPSYFATYMLLGWILVAYLLNSKSIFMKRRLLIIIFIVETAVLILSSSRMGWLMMVFWFLQYPVKVIIDLIHKGYVKKRYVKYSLLLICFLLIGILLVSIIGGDKLKFLLNGIGLAGTDRGSVNTRMNGFFDTLKIFKRSPLIGYSLGGIAPAIGNLYGVIVNNMETAKNYEGISVFAEVLAASGIFGFIIFVLYVFKLIIAPIKLSIKSDAETGKLLKAMTVSLVFELIVLQFNQNILRIYLWQHIALLSILYSTAKTEYDNHHNIIQEAS